VIDHGANDARLAEMRMGLGDDVLQLVHALELTLVLVVLVIFLLPAQLLGDDHPER